MAIVRYFGEEEEGGGGAGGGGGKSGEGECRRGERRRPRQIVAFLLTLAKFT
jgi:hypothetical protein